MEGVAAGDESGSLGPETEPEVEIGLSAYP